MAFDMLPGGVPQKPSPTSRPTVAPSDVKHWAHDLGKITKHVRPVRQAAVVRSVPAVATASRLRDASALSSTSALPAAVGAIGAVAAAVDAVADARQIEVVRAAPQEKTDETEEDRVCIGPLWRCAITLSGRASNQAAGQAAAVGVVGVSRPTTEPRTKLGGDVPRARLKNPCPAAAVGVVGDSRPAKKRRTLGCDVRQAVANLGRPDLLIDFPKDANRRVDWLHQQIHTPWTTEPMPRFQALNELHQANPLSEHMGHQSRAGLCAFIMERELVRIRRHVLLWPRHFWTAHWVFQRVRFTNVERTKDRATRAVIATLAPVKREWERLKTDGVAWSAQQCDIVGSVILTVALWRAFGTPIAVKAIGLQLGDWDASQWKIISMNLSSAAFDKRRGLGDTFDACEEFCFTRAHKPPQLSSVPEAGCVVDNDTGGLAEIYRIICKDSVVELAKKATKKKLVSAAMRGPRAFTEALVRVSGFGGNGFKAKEVMEDVKLAGIFDHPSIPSDRDWAMPGPGARRGCNRIAGRSLGYGVATRWARYPPDAAAAFVAEFLEEMRVCLEECRKLWPAASTGRPDLDALVAENLASRLECGDIQFQLCEADKAWRALAIRGSTLAVVLEKLKKLNLRAFEPSDVGLEEA